MMNNNIFSITVENTSVCGANCIMCPRDKYCQHFEHMSDEVFMKVVESVERLNIKQIDIGGYGDPLADPRFVERVYYLKERFPDIVLTTITTGQLLFGKIADCVAKYIDNIKISNYGITKATYESVHRGSLNYDSIKNNIDSFLDRKERNTVILTFLILEQNRQELDMWIENYKEKADSIQIWYPHNFVGYKKEYNGFSCDSALRSCGRIGKDFYIHKNGDISVCCFDFNHDLVVGNILRDKLEDYKNMPSYNEIYECHKNNKYDAIICKECDQIRDRSKCLYYSSDSDFKVGDKSQKSV